MLGEKVCTRCQREQPIGQYYVRVGRPLGVQSACKRCTLARKRERYRADPEAVLDYLRARRAARRFAAAVAVPTPATEMPMPMLKQCTGCRQDKPTTAFGASWRGADGKHSRCRLCRKAEGAHYRARKAAQRAPASNGLHREAKHA